MFSINGKTELTQAIQPAENGGGYNVERVEWLSEKAYNHMMSGITIEEAQKINDLIDQLR